MKHTFIACLSKLGHCSQVVPSLAIHDCMRHIESDSSTVGFGGCMGMSGFLLAVGKKVILECWLTFLVCSAWFPLHDLSVLQFPIIPNASCIEQD